MLARIGWTFAILVALLAAVPWATYANAEGVHRGKKARVHKKTAALSSTQKKRFAARRRSMFGGRGTAPLAYFVCRDSRDVPIMGKTPEQAQSKCEKAHKDSNEKAPCRCSGRDAVGVYGPFSYPKPKPNPDEWYSNSEYPYEGTNREQYSRDGYLPTP